MGSTCTPHSHPLLALREGGTGMRGAGRGFQTCQEEPLSSLMKTEEPAAAFGMRGLTEV